MIAHLLRLPHGDHITLDTLRYVAAWFVIAVILAVCVFMLLRSLLDKPVDPHEPAPPRQHATPVGVPVDPNADEPIDPFTITGELPYIAPEPSS